jgi:hypothetical protein
MDKMRINMENKKFIITTNEESAALLIHSGLKLVNQNERQWTFLNEGKLLFENIQNITYTNKLMF